jgi:Spy/CpxP family protein refolding chaperone
MLRKITLALVAAASLGTMALAPTSASAGGFWPHHHHNHLHFGVGFVDPGFNGCYRTRMVWTPFGYRLRTINVCRYY